MSILRAIDRAYDILVQRDWDSVYWAVDLHGTLIESNYQTGVYSYINPDVLPALQSISQLSETKLILWSSMHVPDQENIMAMLRADGVNVSWFNENPEVENTETGCFTSKFYFSVLVDDKAGFDPSEWEQAKTHTLNRSREWQNGRK